MPATQRYEHWLMPLLSGVQAVSPNARQRHDFDGRVTSLVTATSELHDMQSDDFEVLHSREGVRRDEDDKLALVYVMRGRVLSQNEGDTDIVAEPGQFLLFDARRAHRVRFVKPHFVQVNLPRAYLQAMLSRDVMPSRLSRAVLSSGLRGILGAQLQQFHTVSAGLTAQEQQALLHATESLATAVVEHACQSTGMHDNGRYYGCYIAAQQFIRLHLGDADLNAERIVAALGCSRSMLYRAFAEQQLSLAEHIRELRLQTLARALQRPAEHRSIAQLAFSCGLHDAPNLSRLFRHRFGITPLEFRVSHGSNKS